MVLFSFPDKWRLIPRPTGIAGDVATQTDRVMRNLSGILKAAGTGLEKVVRSVFSCKTWAILLP